MSDTVTLLALPGLPMVAAGDDLGTMLADAMARAGVSPQPGDVLAVAQKIVSKAEGRSVPLASVSPSARAQALGAETGKDPRLVEYLVEHDIPLEVCPTSNLATRAVASLDEHPLPALVALFGRDAETTRRLEAYLDRRHPAWRVDAQGDSDPGPRRAAYPGAMTEQEAYEILGLERGASLEQVRAAHRTLMKRLHPDQGGTAEQAARVNAARDRLNNRHR